MVVEQPRTGHNRPVQGQSKRPVPRVRVERRSSAPVHPRHGGSSRPKPMKARERAAGAERSPVSQHTRVAHPIYNLLPTGLEGFDSLAELALDLRWSWSHSTDLVWRQLDPALWEITHNPWVVLQTTSRDRIERMLADRAFRELAEGLLEDARRASKAPAWFQRAHPDAPLTCAAFFSMEFMLSEALPIYSGGLGNVAGDQLKAASDLGVPVVGVGLLYQQGYFRQLIDKNGEQEALFPYNDPGQLPVTPVRLPGGEWLRLEIALPGVLGLAARLAGPGRPGEALPPGQQRRRQLPRASGDHQRALRRRRGAAPQAGAAPRDRRVAAARARSGSGPRSAT